MIARNLLLYLVLIIIPDLYLFKRYIRPKRIAAWKKLMWFVPGLVMIIFTLIMACSKHFAPSEVAFRLSAVKLCINHLGILRWPVKNIGRDDERYWGECFKISS